MFAGVFMCDMHKPNVQMEVFFKHVQEHEELAPFLLQDADSNTITCWPTNAMLAPQHITNLMMVLQRGNLRFHIDPSGVLDATDSNGNSCHFVQVCKKCYKCMWPKATAKHKLPSTSVANFNDFGNFNDLGLPQLTLVEQRLLARKYTRATIIKLQKAGPPEHWKRALTGHTISFDFVSPTVGVAREIPAPFNELAECFKIVFVGEQADLESVRNALIHQRNQGYCNTPTVKKAVVQKWINYYSSHWRDDPQFADVVFNSSHDMFDDAAPECDVPDEVWNNVSCASNSADASHLANCVQDEVHEYSETHRPHQASSANVGESTSENEVCEGVVMDHSGLVSTSTGDITDQHAREQAYDNLCEHAEQDASFKNLLIKRHHNTAANEFGQQIALLANVCVMLFPFGTKHCIAPERRHTPLSFNRWVQHVLCIHHGLFGKDEQFLYIVFNMMQRHQVLRSISFTITNNSSISLKELEEALKHAANKGSGSSANKRVKQLLKNVATASKHVDGSPEARKALRGPLHGYMMRFGSPVIFFTLNPADVHDLKCLKLCDNQLDIQLNVRFPHEHAGWTNTMLRGTKVANNPVAVAQYFHKINMLLIEFLFNWDPEASKGIKPGNFDENDELQQQNLLGILLAYFGTVEEQGRGGLHTHYVLFVAGLNMHRLCTNLGDKEYVQKILSFLDSIISESMPWASSQADHPTDPERGSKFSRDAEQTKYHINPDFTSATWLGKHKICTCGLETNSAQDEHVEYEWPQLSKSNPHV